MSRGEGGGAVRPGDTGRGCPWRDAGVHMDRGAHSPRRADVTRVALHLGGPLLALEAPISSGKAWDARGKEASVTPLNRGLGQ